MNAPSWRRQGLDGSLKGVRADEVIARTGWLRSVGGSSPYLALRARAGLGRDAVDAAVAAVEICELPAARGCTYVVPAADYALALQAGAAAAEVEIKMAIQHLGVTEKELGKLAEAVVAATARAPLDPRELKEALGDQVRSLGDAGKKKGAMTTLPLVLGRLQSAGELRRIPVNGRLDQQRYRYARWSGLGKHLRSDEIAVELARRFFRWAAPATLAHFAWWAGLGKKDSAAAVADLGLVDAGDDRLVFPDDAEDILAPEKAPLGFLGSIDNLFHLRRDDDVEHHAIVDRGRRVGVWEYDPEAGKVVHATTEKVPGVAAAAAELERWIADELADVRSFSLDSPESRRGRIDEVRRGLGAEAMAGRREAPGTRRRR